MGGMIQVQRITVSSRIRELWPALRIHALSFAGGKIGIGNPAIDPLRRAILTRLRHRIHTPREILELPQQKAFDLPLRGIGSSSSRPLRHLALLADVIAGRPFPVINDVVDCAHLTALFHLLPAFAWDLGSLTPPLQVDLIPPAVEEEAEPCLVDARGPVAGIRCGQLRAAVTTATREFAVGIVDPGLEGGLDPTRTCRRLANWVRALTGATVRTLEQDG